MNAIIKLNLLIIIYYELILTSYKNTIVLTS